MKRIAALALVAVFALPVTAAAETLLLEKARETQNMRKPERGMTMERVRSAYGEPEQTKGPVGEPPITQWLYGDYVVYFEHERVIHAVSR